MNNRPNSFTQSSNNGLLTVLKTECAISRPFDILPDQKAPQPIFKISGLWDTGASATVISKKWAKNLNLNPISKVKTFHAGGQDLVNVYLINLFIMERVVFQMIRVSEGNLPDGVDVLIGMDIITKGDFAVTNVKGRTTFSFRIPSTKTIDYSK